MTEETQKPQIPEARVATRPGTSEVAAHRRRLYQRHLLLFLAVAAARVAVDNVTTPGVQWAHFPLVPWLLVLALHTFGLLSRGYSVGELLIPPRHAAVKDVYTVPLDYELVRARQLHDGVVNAANAVRADDAQLADDAVAAADELLEALERMVADVRQNDRPDSPEGLVPQAQGAVEALDDLHARLLRFELVQGEEGEEGQEGEEDVPVAAVREQAETIRRASS